MNNKVFEWPDRKEAKDEHQRHTREEGLGCFMIGSQPGVDLNEPGWKVAVPVWATAEVIKKLNSQLRSPATQAIESAYRGKDHTVLIILNPGLFQIIKIPFDAKKECTLIFEARQEQ
jgi:hypothetical protein